MAFQFPPSPAVNQTFTPVAGTTYRWSGTAWHLLAGPGAFITTADADTRYVNVDEAQNTTNRIINGKMAIDQRNAGAAVNSVNGALVYGADRWGAFAAGAPLAFNLQRRAHSSRPKEFMLTAQVTTSGALPAGGTYNVTQRVEGVNLVDLNLGAAGAQSFMFACEIVSSVSGTFSISFRNGTGTRSYVTTYNATANVPVLVSTVIPGDTSGAWIADTGIGMLLDLGLGTDAAFQAPAANTWQAGNFTSVAGCTNLLATAGATLSLSNVRLYKGAVDFGPDRRLYAEELALCQRYYQKSFNQALAPATNVGAGTGETRFRSIAAGATTGDHYVYLSTSMRATPTVTLYNPVAANNQINMFGTGDFTSSTGNGSTSNLNVAGTQPAGATVNGLCLVHWTASAEL